MPFGTDQPGARQDAEMRRHRVLRHLKPAGYLARSEAARFMAHQKLERIEARSLRQRTQGGDGRLSFHISSIADIQINASPTVAITMQATTAIGGNPTRTSATSPAPISSTSAQDATLLVHSGS